MLMKQLTGGTVGGGGTPTYVTFEYTVNNYAFFCIAPNETTKGSSKSIAATETSGASFDTPIATFTHSANSHTFTIAYKVDCTVDGTKKTANTSETVSDYYTMANALYVANI